MRVFAALLLGALVASGGCKKRRTYDRSTPEATVRSFFAALDEGHIPDDLPLFVADTTEIASWRMRCKNRGCERGELTVRQQLEHTDYTAVLVVDYSVFGTRGARVMRGEESPIRLQREGDAWRIVQFGRRIPARSEQPPEDAGLPGDAGDAAAGDDDAR